MENKQENEVLLPEKQKQTIKKKLLEDNFDIAPVGLEFCFDREQFVKESFSIERFVSQSWNAYAAGGLEKLRDDLIQYFNILKSSLIELINQDYADFVNLSTHLVGLDKAINTIRAPLDKTQSELNKVKSHIDQIVREIEQLNGKKQNIANQKNLIHNLQNINECLLRLEKWLSLGGSNETANQNETLPHENRSQRLERIGNEFMKLQYFLKKCASHPFIAHVEQKTELINSKLNSQLESSLSNCLTTIFAHQIEQPINSSSSATTSSAAANQDASKVLSQLLRTYVSLNRLERAERIFRLVVAAPIISAIFDKFCPSDCATMIETEKKQQQVEQEGKKRGGEHDENLDDESVASSHSSLNVFYTAILQFSRNISSQFRGVFASASSNQKQERLEILAEFHFLANAIWPEFVAQLIQRAKFLFSPGNPRLFHQRYSQSMHFLSEFEEQCESRVELHKLRHCTAYTDFVNKWSLPVYFQIKLQEVSQCVESALLNFNLPQLLAASNQSAQPISSEEASPGVPNFQLALFGEIARQLCHLWSARVFLFALQHRFWKFSLQILHHLADCLLAFDWTSSQNKLPATPNTAPTKISKTGGDDNDGGDAITLKLQTQCFGDVIRLCDWLISGSSDTSESANQSHTKLKPGEFVRRAVFARLFPLRNKHSSSDNNSNNNNNDDVTDQSECEAGLLLALNQPISRLRREIIGDQLSRRLRNAISQQCVTQLTALADIPRQYRKMNRPIPSKASPYIAQCVATLQHFDVQLRNNLMQDEQQSMTSSARVISQELMQNIVIDVTKSLIGQLDEVLTSIRKMEESLAKFRRARDSQQTNQAANQTANQTANQVALPISGDDEKIRLQLRLDSEYYVEHLRGMEAIRGAVSGEQTENTQMIAQQFLALNNLVGSAATN